MLSTEARVHSYIYQHVAATGRVPQALVIARALDCPLEETRDAIRRLADARMLVLAPNGGDIWAAEPFCATPTEFRVDCGKNTYWALCIWDALGIPAALHQDAVIQTSCGDCRKQMQLAINDGQLASTDTVVHFGVPARHFWDNLAFT
jgi:hypothetical protein